jgi:uncharacterized protein YukE
MTELRTKDALSTQAPSKNVSRPERSAYEPGFAGDVLFRSALITWQYEEIERLQGSLTHALAAHKSTLEAMQSPVAQQWIGATAPNDLTFQAQVAQWMLACFGEEIARDRIERNHRFLEEALELVQANGCTPSEANQLVQYVFSRPAGDLAQEIGGVMVTLAALCNASDANIDIAASDEIARVWTKIDQIRAKQAGKPKHSPLPGPTHEPPAVLEKQRDHWRKQCRDLQDILRNIGECISGHDGHVFDDVHALLEQSQALKAPTSSQPPTAPVACRKLIDSPYDPEPRYTYRDGEIQGWEPLYAVPPASSQPPAPEWSPIETAPKDGTVLLGYRHQLGSFSWIVIMFDRINGVWFNYYTGKQENPTHWQPLSKPCSTATKGDGQ